MMMIGRNCTGHTVSLLHPPPHELLLNDDDPHRRLSFPRAPLLEKRIIVGDVAAKTPSQLAPLSCIAPSSPSPPPPTPQLSRSTSSDSRDELPSSPSPPTPSRLHHYRLARLPQMDPKSSADTPTIPSSNSAAAVFSYQSPSSLSTSLDPPVSRSSTTTTTTTTTPTATAAAPPPKRNPYPCPLAQQYGCPDRFTTSGHAARHAKKHTGRKEAICPECHKAFTRKDNMEQHRRTHQNPKKSASNSVDEPRLRKPPVANRPSARQRATSRSSSDANVLAAAVAGTSLSGTSLSGTSLSGTSLSAVAQSPLPPPPPQPQPQQRQRQRQMPPILPSDAGTYYSSPDPGPVPSLPVAPAPSLAHRDAINPDSAPSTGTPAVHPDPDVAIAFPSQHTHHRAFASPALDRLAWVACQRSLHRREESGSSESEEDSGRSGEEENGRCDGGRQMLSGL